MGVWVGRRLGREEGLQARRGFGAVHPQYRPSPSSAPPPPIMPRPSTPLRQDGGADPDTLQRRPHGGRGDLEDGSAGRLRAALCTRLVPQEGEVREEEGGEVEGEEEEEGVKGEGGVIASEQSGTQFV